MLSLDMSHFRPWSFGGRLVPELARSRQVIAVEFQGHGHTADIDRPITYEHLADDTAALLRHLEIDSADVYGYSLGGGVALQVALRQPPPRTWRGSR
jgi:pimeloyl-ACP methyl ester carboxylesterase